MDAFLLVHHERVHEVELVEADGSASDGADEAALQQADVVIVDVDVGKDVGEDRAQHIACIEEFFDAAGVHTLDNGLFAFGILTVDGLGGGLLNGDGQDHLVGFGRYLHLILEEGEFLVDAFLHFLRRDVVDGHLHLLVLLVLVIVVLLQLQGFLVLDDFLHELYGRVVLARVLLFLGLDNNLGEHHVGRSQLHVEYFCAGGEFHFFGDVTYGGECQLIPAFTSLYLVFSLCIGDASHAFSFILYGDVHQRFVGEGVCYDPFYLRRHTGGDG